MITILKQINIATMMIREIIKGGEGSGNFGHSGREGMVGGSGEDGGGIASGSKEVRIPKEISAWSNKHGITDSHILASVSRSMSEKDMSLKDAVSHAYTTRERQQRRQLGNDLYEQMVREGSIKNPKGPKG